MATNSRRPKERDGVLSALNVLIEASNLAKEISSATPARAVFGSFAVILTMIVESLANQQDYIELGLNCAEICKVLDRGTKGRGTEHLSRSVREAINQLTAWVEPTMYDLDGWQITFHIAELWRRSRRMSRNRASATQFPAFST